LLGESSNHNGGRWPPGCDLDPVGEADLLGATRRGDTEGEDRIASGPQGGQGRFFCSREQQDVAISEGLERTHHGTRQASDTMGAMKMIGWNCQGKGRNLNSSKKMEFLAKLMYSTGAQVIFISETRSSKCTTMQLNNRFNIADSFVVPSNGLSDGLWLLWTDEVHVDVKFSNHHIILATVVNIANRMEFVLAFVYGDPHHRQTGVIWNHVLNFVHDNLGKPMACMGDLNNIMCDLDTTSANVNLHRMRTFNGYVKQCGLFDLGFSGPAYTWTNKRFSSTPVFERLDRCLANAEWCDMFPIQMCSIFLSFLVIMLLFLCQLNLSIVDQNLNLNLKTGGPWKRTSRMSQKLLGICLLINLSTLERLTLQGL
jgi:hypothetical protein